MKKPSPKQLFLTAILCLQTLSIQAFEYEVQLDNHQVCIAKAKILPYEEIALHRDEYPQVVIALKGGTITRLESNGTQTEVHFPTGVAVFRECDPPNDFHKSVNHSSEVIELLIVHLKGECCPSSP